MTLKVNDLSEVCSLSKEDLASRRALLRRQLFPFIRKREERPSSLVLHFDASPERREQLQAFVDAERLCCSGIDWQVQRVSDSLQLEIGGIDPKSPAFAELVPTTAKAVP